MGVFVYGTKHSVRSKPSLVIRLSAYSILTIAKCCTTQVSILVVGVSSSKSLSFTANTVLKFKYGKTTAWIDLVARGAYTHPSVTCCRDSATNSRCAAT